MQVKGRVEALHRGPERQVLRRVEVDHGVGITHLRKAVNQRALEAKVFHAALEFARRHVGILHRQRGKALETVGTLYHLLGEKIVGAAGDFIGALGVGNGLDGRRVKRQDHHFHAVFVHLAQALAVNVHQTITQFRPDAVGQKAVGILQRVVDGKVFFESDFSLHCCLLLLRRRKPAYLFGLCQTAGFVSTATPADTVARPPAPLRRADGLGPSDITLS